MPQAAPAQRELDPELWSDPPPAPPVPAPRVLILAALLIALFDLSFYQGSAGIVHALLLFAAAEAIALVLRPRFTRAMMWTSGALLLLTGRLLWQSSALTLSIAGLALFAWAAAASGWPLRIPELIGSQLRSLLRAHRGLRALLRAPVSGLGKLLAKPGRLIPFLIPGMVVLVFLLIFRSANPLVARWLVPIESWLEGSLTRWWTALPSIGRVTFWVLAGLLVFAYLQPARWVPARLQAWLGPGELLKPPAGFHKSIALEARTARNTLFAVNALFLTYNLIDAHTLWIDGALPEGLSYSTYARQGTAWLTLALGLTSLVLGGLFSGQLNFYDRGARLLRGLAWLWLAQNLFLALGTFQRLRVYIDYNGLTRLRIVGAFGICLVVIGLVIVMVKVQGRRSFLWMLRQQTQALACALLLLAITPFDALVSRVNTARVLAGEEAPLVQITTQPLSAEGLPALLLLLDHEKALIRQGVAAVLRRKLDELRARRPLGWRQGEGSLYRALDALRSSEERLRALAPTGQRAALEKAFEDYVRHYYY